MVLLLSSLEHAGNCARQLNAELHDLEPIEWAATVPAARKLARRAPGDVTALVVDQSSIDLQSPLLDTLLEETGAPPLIVNLALQDAARLQRDIRALLRRSQAQRCAAVEVAKKLIGSSIKADLTVILLKLQSALRRESISAMEPGVKSALEAADRIRDSLNLPQPQG